MTQQQPQTIRVQVSAWLEYQIDNPNALGDAGAFTPDELDPDGKTNLRSVPPELYRQPATALIIEVAKRSAAEGIKIPHPTIPGATLVGGGGPQFSIVPPGQHGVTPTPG
ncbi:hypothetical protein [Mycobacterium interjectum]|uniref:hypothetical protein n=1 Tax=Mycobacterium interjectum TaxID=33895 RepID=UPI000831DD20|nr:hypothetical protein [Mycobacterium interjectum]MCV7091146.1 hypothetical protein [Mycobacterium interjectum]